MGLLVLPLAQRIGKSLKEIQKHCQPNEYHSSAKLFHDFLTHHDPFRKNFTSSSFVGDFYREIRCGLLHEAATKGKAKIRAHKYEAPECLAERTDDGSLVLYRNSFLQGIESYIKEYKKELLHSSLLQRNLLRKMDDICQIKRMYLWSQQLSKCAQHWTSFHSNQIGIGIGQNIVLTEIGWFGEYYLFIIDDHIIIDFARNLPLI